MTKKLLIYYLDDEIDLCEIFFEAFSNDAVEIKTFLLAEDFLNAYAQLKPDLIFLDFRLKKTTGEEVAKQLDSAIPIYLISGDQNSSHEFQFIKIISKPYQFADIREIILGHLPLL